MRARGGAPAGGPSGSRPGGGCGVAGPPLPPPCGAASSARGLRTRLPAAGRCSERFRAKDSVFSAVLRDKDTGVTLLGWNRSSATFTRCLCTLVFPCLQKCL